MSGFSFPLKFLRGLCGHSGGGGYELLAKPDQGFFFFEGGYQLMREGGDKKDSLHRNLGDPLFVCLFYCSLLLKSIIALQSPNKKRKKLISWVCKNLI